MLQDIYLFIYLHDYLLYVHLKYFLNFMILLHHHKTYLIFNKITIII